MQLREDNNGERRRTSSNVAHFDEVSHVVRLDLALNAVVLRPPSFKFLVGDWRTRWRFGSRDLDMREGGEELREKMRVNQRRGLLIAIG